jgi:hypothetical protein
MVIVNSGPGRWAYRVFVAGLCMRSRRLSRNRMCCGNDRHSCLPVTLTRGVSSLLFGRNDTLLPFERREPAPRHFKSVTASETRWSGELVRVRRRVLKRVAA